LFEMLMQLDADEILLSKTLPNAFRSTCPGYHMA